MARGDGTARRAAGSTALGVLLGVLGFVVGVLALRPLVPWPSELGLRAKVEHFAAHRDEYDAVVFGTSFSQYGLDPLVLDGELERLGRSRHTFNFAVAGMNAYELDHLLRRVLDPPPARLSALDVETVAWNPPDVAWLEGEFQPRAVHWHDPRETLSVSRAVLDAPGDATRAARWGLVAVHLRLMVQNLTNFAQGPAMLDRLLGLDDPFSYLQPYDLSERRGFRPLLEADDEEIAARRARFLENVPAYARRVAKIEAANARLAKVQQANLPALVGEKELLLGTGAVVTWYVPPADSPSAEFYALGEDGTLPGLLRFNRPSRYPELYRLDSRFDRGHLNERGAAAWSRDFAAELVAGPDAP